MEAPCCPNAAFRARVERDGCSSAMSSCAILYAFLGKRCTADNIETQGSKGVGADVSVPSERGSEQSGAEFLVSQTKGCCSASIIGNQRREPGERGDSSPVVESCASKESKSFCGKKTSKRITKAKLERLLQDEFSLVEAGGKLKARIGSNIVPSRVAAVEEKDPNFQKAFTQTSSNTTLPDSAPELHSSGKCLFNELNGEHRTAGSSRKNSKESRKRQNLTLAIHTAGNVSLIAPEAAELSSAAGEKSLRKTRKAVVMDQACRGNSMRKEESWALREKLNERERLGDDMEFKNDIRRLDKGIEVVGSTSLEKTVDEAKIRANEPRKGRLRSSTINFGTVAATDSQNILQVKEKKGGLGKDKSRTVSPKIGRTQNKSAGDIRRSSRNMQLAEIEEDSPASSKEIASGKDKQQEQDARAQMEKSTALLEEMMPVEDVSTTVNDFFVPASKKGKAKKKLEMTAAIAINHQEVRKRPSEGTHAQVIKGLVSINLKQSLKDEEFFKPASKKHKQVASKVAKIQHPDVALKAGTTMSAGNGVGNSDFCFDLRMEAKLAAEENAQLCAGKPTHPFFVHNKAGHRSLDSSGVAIEGGLSHQASSFTEAEELIPSAPFHVTQISKMEEYEAAWQGWNLAEIAGTEKAERSPLKEGSSGSHPKELCSLLRLHVPNGPSKTSREERHCGTMIENGFEPLINILKEHDSKGIVPERLTLSDDESLSSMHSLDHRGCTFEPSAPVSSDIQDCSIAQNALWTEVHQPQFPEEVCGNKETVKSLNAWLQSWQSKCRTLVGCLEGEKNERKTDSAENCDEDLGWFQEDSDSDGSPMEDDALQNVLFLAGPVGCGKTAAIYACARDQGCTIIEVNASDNRSGALIKQKFGEAVESHHLAKWSADTSAPSTAPCCTGEKFSAERIAQQAGGTKVACIDKNLKPASVARKRGALAATENKRLKQGSPTCLRSETEEVSFQAILESEKDLSMESESKTMTVMLFEDVDMIFEEDRGFMTALTQLAETTKRPIILTSNDQELVLPHALGTHFLGFKRPSTKEVMALACRVCVAEGIPCSPEFLERLVKVCKHDIRKLLNFLQFWYQGNSHARLPKSANDSKVLRDDEETGMHSKFEFREIDHTAGTWLYDLEAQHRLWPVLIPLGFPCSAGELIACKLSATILETEERLYSAEEKKIELEDAQNAILSSKIKKQHKYTSPAKVMDEDTDEREEIDTEETSFSQPCLSADADESLMTTPVKRLKEAKTMARSPILRKRIKRSLAIIMSDSDDDAQNASQVEKHHQDPVNTDSTNLSERCSQDGTPINSLNTDAAIKNDLCVTGDLAEPEYRNRLLSEGLDANSFRSSMTGEVRDANINCQVIQSYASLQEENTVLLVKEKDRTCLTIETSKLPCQVALCDQESCPDLIVNDAGETSSEVHKADLPKENACVHGHLTQICAASENASFELRVGNGCGKPSEYTPQRACLAIASKGEGNMELLRVCLKGNDILNSVKGPSENMLNCSDECENDVFCVPHAQVLPTPKALIQVPLLNSMNTEVGSLSGNTLSEHPLLNTACSHDISASRSTSLREEKLCKPVGLEVGGMEMPVDPGSLQLKINESLGGAQKTSYTEQSQPSHCSGPPDSLNAIVTRTEVMVCNDSGQMDALVPSGNSNPSSNVTGHHGSVSNYANEKSSDCDQFTNYYLQSTPEEGKEKSFFTEAFLDSDACLPSVEVCVNKLGETLGCLTGSIKNSSSGLHVQLLQSSNVSVGGLTNSVKIETRGKECPHLSSNSETPQLEGICHCSFLGDPPGKDGEDNAHVDSYSLQSVSEAVRSLWSHLRNSREEYGLVPSTASQNSLTAVVSLSNLADSLSACDIITSTHGSKAFEEMAGINAHKQKSNSGGLLRTCGQMAHIALQLCLQECYPLTKSLEETRICPSPEHMLLALNHPCTLGKLAVCERWPQSADGVHSEIGPSSFEQDFKRLERKSAVQNALSNGLPARAQGTLSGSAFHEYASFVARIGHLEQARQSSGFGRRRCRGSQHYFSIHPWHLSEENITTLQEVCSFDRH